jgi:hypothetical protein
MKKCIAITAVVVILILILVFVFPFGSGYLSDGGTRFYTPLFHWYMIYDYNTRSPSVPVYAHDGEEHDLPKTKTVSGGTKVYIFGQKIYDNSYETEVPIDS